MSYIELSDCTKTYQVGDTFVSANDHVSFSVEKGELVVILGSSGAGKSTLLNILGGMDTCDSGKILIDGVDISTFNSRQLTAYRRNEVGFIFQFYNLVPNLTAKENVELASEIVSSPLPVDQVLSDVGLSSKTDIFPAQLSGGEQQRVAIARALAKNPKILLCDEPTGALDSFTGQQILETLTKMREQHNATIIIVTHNRAISRLAHRVIELRDGQVIREDTNPSPASPSDIEW